MRGISHKELLTIDPWQHDNQQDLLNHILDECQELNPWLTLEEFLKSGYRGLCWVVIDKNQVEMVRLDITFTDIKLNMPIQKERITRAQPIHKPELPQDEHNDKMPLVR